MNQLAEIVSSYEDISAEYYNPVRHPTCANFADLSQQILVPRIQKHAQVGSNTLEVGAGRSVVAPVMVSEGLPLANLTLLDLSPRMLEHSRKWTPHGTHFIVGDACNTGLPTAKFQLIVSSLGDPYNYPIFWQEIRRLLDQVGVCLFTIPAPEWAARFRAGSDPATAEFLLTNGARVLVRSNIPPIGKEIEMITMAGLRVDEMQDLSSVDLSSPRSPKLLIEHDTAHLPIVRGLTIRAS